MKVAPDLQPLLVPVEDLTLLPDNPRRGDIEALAQSLQSFGQRKPIVIDAAGVIVAGNHTFQAAVQLGWTQIAATYSDDLTPEEIRAYALADNRLSDLARYDNEALARNLRQSQSEGVLRGTGFTDVDVDTLEADLTIPNDFIPVGADTQPRMDQVGIVKCPDCGSEFQP